MKPDSEFYSADVEEQRFSEETRSLPRPAAIRLYVVNNLRHLRDAAAGDLTWWCVEARTVPGERAAIYLTGHGVALLFSVQATQGDQERFCTLFGMRTASIRVDKLIDPPIAAREMRAHPILSRMPALRRSFQKRSFLLEPRFLDALDAEASQRA